MQGMNLLQIYWTAADNIKNKFSATKMCALSYVVFSIESPKVKITSASCIEEK